MVLHYHHMHAFWVFVQAKKKGETNSCTGGHLTLSINYAVQRLGETGFVFCSYFVHIYIFSSCGWLTNSWTLSVKDFVPALIWGHRMKTANVTDYTCFTTHRANTVTTSKAHPTPNNAERDCVVKTNGSFTAPDTDTKTDTDTNKMCTEPNRNLHRSLRAVQTTPHNHIQVFYRSLSVSRCRPV